MHLCLQALAAAGMEALQVEKDAPKQCQNKQSHQGHLSQQYLACHQRKGLTLESQMSVYMHCGRILAL